MADTVFTRLVGGDTLEASGLKKMGVTAFFWAMHEYAAGRLTKAQASALLDLDDTDEYAPTSDIAWILNQANGIANATKRELFWFNLYSVLAVMETDLNNVTGYRDKTTFRNVIIALAA